MQPWFTEAVITEEVEEVEEASSQEAAGVEADHMVGDRAVDIVGFTNILAAAM